MSEGVGGILSVVNRFQDAFPIDKLSALKIMLDLMFVGVCELEVQEERGKRALDIVQPLQAVGVSSLFHRRKASTWEKRNFIKFSCQALAEHLSRTESMNKENSPGWFE